MNAIIYIQAGAGGRESNDWARMLAEMYAKYVERHDFHCRYLDAQPCSNGDSPARFALAINSAYPLLVGESGVHRLVRISPFDPLQRRHTSFCSVRAEQDLGNEDGNTPIYPEPNWDEHIRSYIMSPYTVVTDHRTKLSDANTQRVLDGHIGHFIGVWQEEQLRQ